MPSYQSFYVKSGREWIWTEFANRFPKFERSRHIVRALLVYMAVMDAYGKHGIDIDEWDEREMRLTVRGLVSDAVEARERGDI